MITSGATASSYVCANMINHHSDDEVILLESTHSSNYLPWVNKNWKIKICKLLDYHLPVVNLISLLSPYTKVVVLHAMSNVLGYDLDLAKTLQIVKDYNPNIITVVDACQYQYKVFPIVNADIWFISAHKHHGPSGVGALCISDNATTFEICSVISGGGMAKFKLGGTPPVASVIGWGATVDWLLPLQANLRIYTDNLSSYAYKAVKSIGKVISSPNSHIISLYHSYAEDLAIYLAAKNIYVRSGLCCAPYATDGNIIRISLCAYNDQSDIDRCIEEITKALAIIV